MSVSHKMKKKKSKVKTKIKYKKNKKRIYFLTLGLHLIYTNYNLLLNSSRDFPRLKLLQFDFRSDLFLFPLSPLNIPTIHAFVRRPRPLPRTLCVCCTLFHHIRRKDRWNIDGSLGTSAIYIVTECRHIFISVISPSDLKCADRDISCVTMRGPPLSKL